MILLLFMIQENNNKFLFIFFIVEVNSLGEFIYTKIVKENVKSNVNIRELRENPKEEKPRNK